MNQNLLANTIFRYMYATPRILFRKRCWYLSKRPFWKMRRFLRNLWF